MLKTFVGRPDAPEYEGERPRIAAALEPAWREYVGLLERQDHALSLETATLLTWLCRVLRPSLVVDLGSGFSSHVFRQYAAGSPETQVITVDDDPAWLDRTRRHIKARGLSTDKMLTFEAFEKAPVLGDLVLYDLGNMAFRPLHLRWALNLLAVDGLCVVDDIHKPEFRPVVDAAVEEAGMVMWPMPGLTLDEHTRFAGLVHRFGG